MYHNSAVIFLIELMNLRRLLTLRFNVFSPKEYEIIVITADADDAETKENAWIVLEGRKGRSKELVLENSSKKKRFSR